jgi:hypothetical protein
MMVRKRYISPKIVAHFAIVGNVSNFAQTRAVRLSRLSANRKVLKFLMYGSTEVERKKDGGHA